MVCIVAITLLLVLVNTKGFLDNKATARSIGFILAVSAFDVVFAILLWKGRYTASDWYWILGYTALLGFCGMWVFPRAIASDPKHHFQEKPDSVGAVETAKTYESDSSAQASLVSLPDKLYLNERLKELCQTKGTRVLIFGPYGSGKETLAVLIAYHNCEFVYKADTLFLSRTDDRSFNCFDEGTTGFVVPDIQMLSDNQKEKFKQLIDKRFAFYATSTNFDICDTLPELSSFIHIYIPPLSHEEIVDCFKFFMPEDISIEEIKWDFVASLLKMVYVPQIKQLVEWTLQEYFLDQENQAGLVRKVHLAKALEKFLSQPI